MKRTIQLLLLLPLLWAAGCQKEASKTESEKAGIAGVEVPVTIQATFSDPAKPTKAIIQGTEIPNAFGYGIFVCKNGATNEAHKANSWNLKATYETSQEEGMAGSWTYQYVNDFNSGALSINSYPNITITSRVDEATADIYAYAPYMKEAYEKGPTAIPFSIAQDNQMQVDLMYAIENMDPTKNKGLDPLSAGDELLTADFTFKHALALLCFEFTVKNRIDGVGTERSTLYRLQDITIKNNGTSTVTKLYESGEFDAITGDFKNCVETQSLVIKQYNPGSQEYLPLEPSATPKESYVTLVPTQIEDDDLEIIVQVDNRYVKPIKIKKADLKHADGEEYGFQGGYKYTFKFTLDNYLFLNGITVNEWETDVTDLTEVEI